MAEGAWMVAMALRPAIMSAIRAISRCRLFMSSLSSWAISSATACSLLHDNALTQYIHEEFHNDLTKNNTENIEI